MISVILLIGIGIIIILSFSLIKIQAAGARRKVWAVKVENTVMKEYCTTLEQQFTQLKKIRHDLANHIEVAKRIDSPREYIEKIELLYRNLKLMQNCENLAIDTVFSYYKERFRSRHVVVEYDIGCIRRKETCEEDVVIVTSGILEEILKETGKKADCTLTIEARRIGYQLVFKYTLSNSINCNKIQIRATQYEKKRNVNFNIENIKEAKRFTICFGQG